MNITITDIDNPVQLADQDGRQLTRFSIGFQSALCGGRAYLYILHRSMPIDIAIVRNAVVGHQVSVHASADTIRNYSVLDRQGVVTMNPLDSIGVYSLEGQIVEHLFTGIGSVFQAGDITLILEVEHLPPDSLEVSVGTWVRFTVEGLGFTPTDPAMS